MIYSAWKIKHNGGDSLIWVAFPGEFQVSIVVSGHTSYGLAKSLQLYVENEPSSIIAKLTWTEVGSILTITNPKAWGIRRNDFILFVAICLFNCCCVSTTETIRIEDWPIRYP